MKQLSFDGNLTLEQLQRTIGTTENAEFIKLVRMEKSSAAKENVGEFEDVDPAADAPPAITLVPAPASVPSGMNQVFESDLYVEGSPTRVLAYR